MFNRRFHKPLFVKRRLYNGSRDFHFTDEPGSIHWRGLYRRVFSLSIQLFDGHMPRISSETIPTFFSQSRSNTFSSVSNEEHLRNFIKYACLVSDMVNLKLFSAKVQYPNLMWICSGNLIFFATI